MSEASEFWIMPVSSVVYFLGIIGAIQVLGLGDSLREGLLEFLRFFLGAVLWPITMPITGLAWLFGIKYWTKRSDS